MSLIGIVLIIALCIPIISILVDGPIGRAWAKRLEREHPPESLLRNDDLAELRRRIDQLEGDVDMLHGNVTQLREENEFLQRLLESGPPRNQGQG